jgi:hypothetical protein
VEDALEVGSLRLLVADCEASRLQILFDREVREDPAPLHHLTESEGHARCRAEAVDASPGELDRPSSHAPAVHAEQTGHRSNGRRLSRAIRSEERNARSRRHLDGHPLERLDRSSAIHDLDGVQPQERRAGISLASARRSCDWQRHSHGERRYRGSIRAAMTASYHLPTTKPLDVCRVTTRP